jgi:two-component system OmpR family response regulator
MPDRPVVMVVEDDVEMNALQRELLDLYGLSSVPAYTGSEALDVNRSRQTDAVLLDVMLPGMDGYETCRQLKSQAAGRLPVILVTALDSDDCRQRGYEAGADAYFSKPFDPDEIVAALQRLLAGEEGTNGGNGNGRPT